MESNLHGLNVTNKCPPVHPHDSAEKCIFRWMLIYFKTRVAFHLFLFSKCLSFTSATQLFPSPWTENKKFLSNSNLRMLERFPKLILVSCEDQDGHFYSHWPSLNRYADRNRVWPSGGFFWKYLRLVLLITALHRRRNRQESHYFLHIFASRIRLLTLHWPEQIISQLGKGPLWKVDGE